jgi:hypothetical protein
MGQLRNRPNEFSPDDVRRRSHKAPQRVLPRVPLAALSLVDRPAQRWEQRSVQSPAALLMMRGRVFART